MTEIICTLNNMTMTGSLTNETVDLHNRILGSSLFETWTILETENSGYLSILSLISTDQFGTVRYTLEWYP